MLLSFAFGAKLVVLSGIMLTAGLEEEISGDVWKQTKAEVYEAGIYARVTLWQLAVNMVEVLVPVKHSQQ